MNQNKKLRKVKIKDLNTTGFFHMFGQFGNEEGTEVLAIVELKDGKIITTFCENIQFVIEINNDELGIIEKL